MHLEGFSLSPSNSDTQCEAFDQSIIHGDCIGAGTGAACVTSSAFGWWKMGEHRESGPNKWR